VVRDPRPVGRVEVLLFGKGVEGRPRRFEVAHSGDHVDDRLRGQTGNGCRADVVDAGLEPRGEDAVQHSALGLEATRPLGVVRNNGDRDGHG